MVECSVYKSHDATHSCSFYLGRFEQCREQRDLSILEGIKQWEEGHIEKLDGKNRQMYLQGLTFKLDRLKEEYEKIPSNSSKQSKLTHVQAEIEQIKWRMKNIRNFISNEGKQKGQ